jgi:hypothetical protein
MIDLCSCDSFRLAPCGSGGTPKNVRRRATAFGVCLHRLAISRSLAPLRIISSIREYCSFVNFGIDHLDVM